MLGRKAFAPKLVYRSGVTVYQACFTEIGRPCAQAGHLRGLASSLARPAVHLRPALVNGAAGVVTLGGRPMTVMGFPVAAGRIVEIDAIADPERVRRIAATVLTDD